MIQNHLAKLTARPPCRLLPFQYSFPAPHHDSSRRSPAMRSLPPAASTSSSLASIPLDPPQYTKLSMPVYSLSTTSAAAARSSGAAAAMSNAPIEDAPGSIHSKDSAGWAAQANGTMNLVTYAAPVSIQPRRYALGLYLGTLSHENFKRSGRGVLQVLRKRHASLFQLLGKTSGRDVDKLKLIREAGFQVVDSFGFPTLADAACVMELVAVSGFTSCGDHDVVICDVVAYKNLADLIAEEDALYTSHLRQMGHMQ